MVSSSTLAPALLFLLHGASAEPTLSAGVSSYSYAPGDKLMVNPGKGSFHGISDLVTLGSMASPLDQSTIKLSEPRVAGAKYRFDKLQNSQEYEGAFNTGASVHGMYGGVTGSVSAKYMQSQKLTSTSSKYFYFYEKALGDQTLNTDVKLTAAAQKELQEKPELFVQKYGRYFVQGYSFGCQATVTLTVTANSEFEKKGLDTEVSATYLKMIGGAANFSGNLQNQDGFKQMQVDVSVYGGSVPAAVDDLEQIKSKVIDPLDDGSKCDSKSARVTRVILKSWASLDAVAEAASADTLKYILAPKHVIAPEVLARLSHQWMLVSSYLSIADFCHKNVFKCITNQWNEKTQGRSRLFTSAYAELLTVQNEIQQTDEEMLKDSKFVLGYELKLEEVYQKWMKPAMSLQPFSFTFNIKVLTEFDSWQDPPPYGTKDVVTKLRIDPNRLDTIRTPVALTRRPALDNGHDNCRHYYGEFYASYQDAKLSVWQEWNRVCGGTGTSEVVVFAPGMVQEGSCMYNGAERTVFDFSVKYNDTMLASALDDDAISLTV